MLASVLEPVATGADAAWADGVAVPEPPPTEALGVWLAAGRAWMDRGEAAWLVALARFDTEAGWAADGALSCVDWLIGHARLARASAFEKLRIARQLSRRAALAQAFAAGQVSYSAVRLITRCLDASPEVDAALIQVAASASLADLERAVRSYLRYRDQEIPPGDERPDPRGVRIAPRGDGYSDVTVTVSDLEAAEIDANLSRRATADQAAETGDADTSPGEESAAADSRLGPAGGPLPQTWTQRRATAAVDLLRSPTPTWAPGADRYTLHLLHQHHQTCILAGEHLDPRALATVRCDCGTIEHHHTLDGQPLAVGRRHRTWNTSQRRAITIRDHGHCRWPGCTRTHVDIHHLTPWHHGGPTDTTNGILACPRHHTLLHTGWTTTGTPNGTLTFHRPTPRWQQ